MIVRLTGTGASAGFGFGEAMAQRFIGGGHHVVAMALRAERLQALRD